MTNAIDADLIAGNQVASDDCRPPEATADAQYNIAPADAIFLAGVVSSPASERITLLGDYVARQGVSALTSLVSELIGCANSVIDNCKSMASLLLVTEGGVHPHTAEDINLPTLAGAMNGVLLASGIDSSGMCLGCAYRLGTPANQSPLTTEDAAHVSDNPGGFMCHENIPEGHTPTQVCVGHAKGVKHRLRMCGDASIELPPKRLV